MRHVPVLIDILSYLHTKYIVPDKRGNVSSYTTRNSLDYSASKF